MPTKHIIVKGKVQGVFFRVNTRKVAEENGLKGWVRNTENGDVEIMASGSEEQLEKLVKWCRRGPEKARVDEVEVHAVAESDFKKFSIK